MVLNVVGTTEPPLTEFISHPSHRQVASFFLGWVFLMGARYTLMSPLVASAIHWLCSRLIPGAQVEGNPSSQTHQPRSSIEKWEPEWDTARDLPQKPSVQDCPALILSLNLFTVFAALAYFASHLSFSADGAVCAFTVAWANISAQLSRLVALVVLLKDLKAAGVNPIEIAFCWTTLFVSLGLGFSNVAIGVGIVKTIDTPAFSIALCYRRQFLPTSIATTSLYSLFELYILFRLLAVHHPSWTLRPSHGQVQVWRVASLLAFELLTAVPSAIFVSILADAATYSVGALMTLVTYNTSIPGPIPADSHDSAHQPHLKAHSTSIQLPIALSNTQSPRRIVPVPLPNHPYSSRQSRLRQGLSLVESNFISCTTESGEVRTAYHQHFTQPKTSPVTFKVSTLQAPPAQLSFWQTSPLGSVSTQGGHSPSIPVTTAADPSSSSNTSNHTSFQPSETTPLTAARRHLRVMSTLLEIPSLNVGAVYSGSVASRSDASGPSSISVVYPGHVAHLDSRSIPSSHSERSVAHSGTPIDASYGSTQDPRDVSSPRSRKPIWTSGQMSNLAQRVWRNVPPPLTVVPSVPLPNVVACSSSGQSSYTNL